MASFAAQAAIRSKWSDLIEDSKLEVPGEVSEGVRSVVGWLKQASLEVRQAGRRAVSTLSSGVANKMTGSSITIIHYNDVYNVEQMTNEEPVGSACRFVTAVKSFAHLNPLVLFSGDIFSPSMLSTITKGEQMVPVLNDIGTHCAVFGNHDFDFGLEVLSNWVALTEFPWLMSNVIDNETGRPLGDGKITHVVDWEGKRIGLIGLVELEWLDTLSTINADEVTYMDFIQAGTQLATQLKQDGCDYVIALTHMRSPNDVTLAEKSENIDLILGGHDHVYEVLKVNGIHIIKSGTDFRNFSKITLSFSKSGESDVNIENIAVTSSFNEDLALKEKLDKFNSLIEGKMKTVLGSFAVPLEGRFSEIRTKETNLGNWVADVILAATSADLVLLNSGTFRSDRVHPAGSFTLKDMCSVLPMSDPIVVVKISGSAILETLENGVSRYPMLEGRFPQVAGLYFAFDPKQSPGKRVIPETVRIGDEYLVRAQTYRLACKKYMHSGSDGYAMLTACAVLVDEELCPELGVALQNHFDAIKMKTGKSVRHTKHRQSLVTLSRRHSIVKLLDANTLNEFDGPPPLKRGSSIGGCANYSGSGDHSPTPPAHPYRLSRRASLDDLEQQTCMLSPKVENRIFIIESPEQLATLLDERLKFETDSVIKEVEEDVSPQ